MASHRGDTSGKLTDALYFDRLVKIYVGEDPTPFLVQQALLEKTSEFFVKAFRYENLRGNKEIGVLRFPDDKVEAWKGILCWMFRSEDELREILGDPLNAIRCWYTGEKYLMEDFQDEAMVALLAYLETETVSIETMREAVANSAPGSKLRNLIAEEAADQREDGTLDSDKLATLDGFGFMKSFFEAEDYAKTENYSPGNRLDAGKNVLLERMGSYMKGKAWKGNPIAQVWLRIEGKK